MREILQNQQTNGFESAPLLSYLMEVITSPLGVNTF